jgi:hypothetical protein
MFCHPKPLPAHWSVMGSILPRQLMSTALAKTSHEFPLIDTVELRADCGIERAD